ncbi:hypothetical protein N7474_004763 [Penicillium riverlandense]|uniref:uncharacterized protein n=1 Tax=Penicillium riverlandense TaxID=1903569 RepID=UPI002546B1AD|nr:uncharacterized protein N7474_004763 [Penicillium riverlandense]KAJ5819172.1 hypothetical protein N7474_004763 [Penicillium riverlandense]
MYSSSRLPQQRGGGSLSTTANVGSSDQLVVRQPPSWTQLPSPMARLNDDSRRDSSCTSDPARHDADSAGEDTGPDSEHNSSASSTRQSASDIFGRDMDEELEQLKSTTSSRSSLSSGPTSVLVHSLDDLKSAHSMDPHEKVSLYTTHEDDEAVFGGFGNPPRSIHTLRTREAAFRKPSSVRAMQMHTEDEADEDDYLTPPRRRPGLRSPGSSPLKRSPYYSPSASAKKHTVQKEYPLVLLHCNLLSPSLPIPGAADPHNHKLLAEVLPPPYWKRWQRLQEKVGSGVLRDRGVLITHPEDMYDLLEERLLESLELRRSRLHNGHFLSSDDGNPDSEEDFSDRGESETDGEQGEECPDCGGRYLRHADENRKWEIRVFAANGLMRAGAWATAWKEMEKVDVEVGLWLPPDVRRDLKRRLSQERTMILENVDSRASLRSDTELQGTEGLRLPVSQHLRTPSNTSTFLPDNSPSPFPAPQHRPDSGASGSPVSKQPEIALQTLIINYIRVLASDRRNVALFVLSILVAFLSIGSWQQQPPQYSDMRPFPHDMFESASVSSVSVMQSSLSSASIDATGSSAISSPLNDIPVAQTMIPVVKEEAVSLSRSVEFSVSPTGEPEEQSAEPDLLDEVQSGTSETVEESY